MDDFTTIATALRSLPPRFHIESGTAGQADLALCGLLGYDYESASQVLDIPVGTVRSRLHRARSLLAAALEDPSVDTG